MSERSWSEIPLLDAQEYLTDDERACPDEHVILALAATRRHLHRLLEPRHASLAQSQESIEAPWFGRVFPTTPMMTLPRCPVTDCMAAPGIVCTGRRGTVPFRFLEGLRSVHQDRMQAHVREVDRLAALLHLSQVRMAAPGI